MTTTGVIGIWPIFRLSSAESASVRSEQVRRRSGRRSCRCGVRRRASQNSQRAKEYSPAAKTKANRGLRISLFLAFVRFGRLVIDTTNGTSVTLRCAQAEYSLPEQTANNNLAVNQSTLINSQVGKVGAPAHIHQHLPVMVYNLGGGCPPSRPANLSS